MKKLTARLEAVAGLIPPDARLADVGTDHAYLPVLLLRDGKITHAIATDLREGPLDSGRAVARAWKIPEEQISFRKCDGMQGIKACEADTVVIAGMGGETIIGILNGVSWSRERGLHYILQPMSGLPELRLWLCENGFAIQEERLVREENKYYTILSVRPGSMRRYSLAELWAGAQEREDTAPHRAAYLQELIARRRRALAGMRQGDTVSPKQLAYMETLLAELEEMQEEWSVWQQ